MPSDSGSGDFFSLGLVNGYIQFKYDLGSGLANITSRRFVPRRIQVPQRCRRAGNGKMKAAIGPSV